MPNIEYDDVFIRSQSKFWARRQQQGEIYTKNPLGARENNENSYLTKPQQFKLLMILS